MMVMLLLVFLIPVVILIAPGKMVSAEMAYLNVVRSVMMAEIIMVMVVQQFV